MAARLRALIISDDFYAGVASLTRLVESNLEIVTPANLERNPGVGKDLEVALTSSLSGTILVRELEKGTLPNLKVVINHGVGVNHLPFAVLKQHGIKLTNTPAVLSDTAADMALGLMLASGRQFLKGNTVQCSTLGSDRLFMIYLDLISD